MKVREVLALINCSVAAFLITVATLTADNPVMLEGNAGPLFRR